MNIAVLVSGLPPDRIGGAEYQASRVAEHLARRHQVIVFTRTSTVPSTLTNLPACRVIRRSPVNMRGVRFPADIVSTLGHIARRRQAIDVIVAYQTVIDGLIAVLARRLFGIPVLVSVRGPIEYELDRRLQSRLFSPFVFRHADRLAVQTPRLAENFVRVFAAAGVRPDANELRAKLCVVPNGADVGPVTPVGERDLTLFVGRLASGKGVELLIEAMRECPSERLLIVGDGPLRPALEEQARHLPNVSFAGAQSRERTEQHFARARMLVLPSFQEGQPNAVMEAMARGVPVIATPVGGIPDLIEHGRTGLLVTPGDTHALAEAIRALAADAALRTRLAAHARQEIERYSWPEVIEAMERALRNLRIYESTNLRN